MAKEIERKFLMNIDIYDYVISHEYLINKVDVFEQIYLSEEKDIRIRRKVKMQYHVSFMGAITHFKPDDSIEHTLTHKTDNGLEREEYTSIIDSLTYEILSGLQTNQAIRKTRYTLHTGEEIDVYKDTDLIVMEKEFNSIEESESFVNKFEQFTIKEVTDDEHYKNKNISKWIVIT